MADVLKLNTIFLNIYIKYTPHKALPWTEETPAHVVAGSCKPVKNNNKKRQVNNSSPQYFLYNLMSVELLT